MYDRYIFHVDVNSAFLSWSASYRVNMLGEKLDLRTVPSIVGGDQASRHGIVLAKSTPAKQYDIQTGEAIMAAQKKCPELIVTPPDYHLYVAASKAFIERLHKYSDCVTQYSIDEAWAEFDGYEKLYGGIVSFANDLREEIKRELGFTVNIGISTNRLLSKMAGDFKKPDMVHTLFPEEIPEKMWPFSVSKLFFVGRATQAKLHNLGIHTIGELAQTDLSILRDHFKSYGEVIWNYANGNDLVPYVYKSAANKGYGNSVTASADVTDMDTACKLLLSLCETVGIRIRKDNVKISCIAVSITSNEFLHYTHQTQVFSATDITEELYAVSCRVLTELWIEGAARGVAIRQLGVHTSKVSDGDFRQMNLFDLGMNPENADDGSCLSVIQRSRPDALKLSRWNRTVDDIRLVHGEDAILRARYLKDDVSHISGGLDRERRTGITAGLNLDKELQL